MPSLRADQLPALAAALLHLRGDTLSMVSAATGIRAANLSVWLRGKEQVISARRVAGLLYHLGVEGGSLRHDMLHRWHDSGPLDNVQTVLSLLTGSDTVLWLFQDQQTGLTKTRFLLVGDACVRVELSPGVADAKDLAETIQAHRLFTLPTSLAAIPCDSLPTVREALLAMSAQLADIDDEELLAGLMFRLGETTAATVSMATTSPTGWMQLEHALQSAFKRGITPAEIAALIEHSTTQFMP